MATYAIGDVQGCFDQLQELLSLLQFNPHQDKIWFVGDIVNRGPDSLQTLCFIRSLGDHAITVLGNHDLHLLAIANGRGVAHKKDTFDDILHAPDRDELLDWLIRRPLMHYDSHLDISMVHAGIHPEWSVKDALAHAREVEAVLQSHKSHEFFHHMYGDKPHKWSDLHAGWDRLRFITNVFTRMRYLDKITHELALNEKSAPGKQHENLLPWFMFAERKTINNKIVFGHWSTLPNPNLENIYPLDTGCLWGGKLSALEINADMKRLVQLDCPQAQPIDFDHGLKKKKHSQNSSINDFEHTR